MVVLARAGQDLSKYGLRYSHLGFAYRQPDRDGGHVWRVLHKLNQCGTAESAIYRQGLGEFFLDDLWRFEAAWVVPTPEVQARLLAVLIDEPRVVFAFADVQPEEHCIRSIGHATSTARCWLVTCQAMVAGTHVTKRPPRHQMPGGRVPISGQPTPPDPATTPPGSSTTGAVSHTGPGDQRTPTSGPTKKVTGVPMSSVKQRGLIRLREAGSGFRF